MSPWTAKSRVLHFGTPGNDALCGKSVDPKTARQEHYVRERERFDACTNRCPECMALLPPTVPPKTAWARLSEDWLDG